MNGRPDISTVELSRTRLRLREDVRFYPHYYAGTAYYHLEITSTSEYFRVGYEEYTLISLLDGRTSFAEALAVSSRQLREKALTQTRALAVYSWLLENGIGIFADDDTSASGASAAVRGREANGAFWNKLNPLWIRIPLGRPEVLLRTLQPAFGWLYSAAALVPVSLLMIAAVVLLLSHWDQFSGNVHQVIARENWLWLAAAWTGLKMIHEIGHGLVCQKYGGVVREGGLVLAIFAPMAYIDASSSWAFRSRWQRIHTAAAGIYTELLVASVAMILWSQTDSPLLRHQLHNVIMMASLSTLLFNLNPLMKFDGYYILSDMLQIPNLSSQAAEAVRQAFQRVTFGDASGTPVMMGGRRWVLLAYGLASLLWRITVCLTLLIAASVLLHGAGIAVAAAALLMWLAKPARKGLQTIRSLRVQHPERLLRASFVTGFAVLCIGTAVFGLPAPVLMTAPGVIDFEDGEVVRAVTPGFVDTVHVAGGQEVQSGDLLLSLRNDEVTDRFHALQHQLAAEELRMQTAARSHDSGGLSIAGGNLESLRRQLAECRKQADALQIRASRDGIVIGRELPWLSGTFAKAGMELMTIGYEDEKEVRISLSQRDLPTASSKIGSPLNVRIGDGRSAEGTLVRVNPRASRSIPHPALAASSGGELPVEQGEADAGASRSSEKLRLTEHRFTGVVRLPREVSAGVYSGERATVSLGCSGQSLGQYLWTSVYDWIDRQWRQSVEKTADDR